jgi:hypothetical protein
VEEKGLSAGLMTCSSNFRDIRCGNPEGTESGDARIAAVLEKNVTLM